MINRKWKIETRLRVLDEEGKTLQEDIKDIRTVRNTIYSKGTRGKQYMVEEYSAQYGELMCSWIYSFKKEGPIFTKKIYDKLTEMKEKAKIKQFKIELE